MRIYAFLTMGLVATSALAHTSSNTGCSPYLGVALSWDRMLGNHGDKLTNFMEHTLTFSDGARLTSDAMAGYLLFGVEYQLSSLPLFISPEVQLGGGMMRSQANNYVGDEDLVVGARPLSRALNPKLAQKFTGSFAVKVGADGIASTQIYGLVGLNISRFKYGFIYQIVDDFGAINPAIIGTQPYAFSKWRTAPVVGIGIEKKIKDVKIGLEYRMAFYSRLKFSKVVTSGIEFETVTANYKPRTSSVMLRVSYSF